MSFKTKTAMALGVIALLGAATAPAAAAAQPASRTEVSVTGTANAAAWTDTYSYGGWIRECYRASCSEVAPTYNGELLQWSHYAYNTAGNRWYYVRDSSGYTGWIYCGNVTAGC